ncbi:VOC family protein [Vibrio sagamiensis]|uniref:VOC domain-containing protein n=1 Tax=Vibrio sagamiensis NBRC 104589 TaxID=1219064 RepID=A0A511QK66_9VIBR|nr:VOC family protein [Vibrio sagamiensis]GEM77671.1 hypothetical protein VSA01S_37830 [Vibrio sagamiensis NBRC 104589]
MISGLGHINIVVDNIDLASDYYADLLSAVPVQRFNNFKNEGFSKSAGFIDNYNEVDVSIEFLKIGNTNIYLELMEYHSPVSEEVHFHKTPNMIGSVGHICLSVSDIDAEFERVKAHKDVRMISESSAYKPFKISQIKTDEFFFHDEVNEKNVEEKKKVADIVSNTRYFYFVDKYNIQWEFEEGHSDIGD